MGISLDQTTETRISEFAHFMAESDQNMIEWSSLRGRVYYLLRECVVSGRLPPGSVVTLRGIAKALGTSMMPVREAVMRLVTEGAIELNPNRTFSITLLSPARFMEIRDIRIEIEGWAAELAAKQISTEEIDDLYAIQARVEKASKSFDVSYLSWNRRLHFLIYRSARKPELISIIESLWLKYGPVLNYFSLEDDARNHGNEAHNMIVNALVERDGTAARRAIEMDIMTASEVILPRLASDYKSRARKVSSLRVNV
jgi:DNA-binding GntR family transcriptional regulator